MAAMIALTVAGIVVPLAAQLADILYKQWKERKARASRASPDDVVVAIVAQALTTIEASPLNGAEKRAVFEAAFKSLAEKTGDSQIAHVVPATSAVQKAVTDVTRANESQISKMSKTSKMSKSSSSSTSKARLFLTRLVSAPSLVEVVEAGSRAQQIVQDARRSKSGQTLTSEQVFALVPTVLSVLNRIFHFSTASRDEQASFTRRVFEDVMSAAPSAERAAWATALAGIRLSE